MAIRGGMNCALVRICNQCLVMSVELEPKVIIL